MKLIFAQGNPGTKFDRTRHNVGFGVIDSFATSHNLSWTNKAKFHALLADTIIDGEKVILAKPDTFYNETGVSARSLIDFYDLNPSSDLLVIHDDLALPIGTVRTRAQGSDAGNNGIKSLNNHVGPDYHRIRIGIANDLRARMGDIDFVLGTFSKDEADTLTKLQPEIITSIELFIAGKLEHETKKV